MLPTLAVITTLHLTGEVPVGGDEYLAVPFQVPAGTVELEVAHDDGSASQILDWGVGSPDGVRGWGGGLTEPAVIGVDESSRGYLAGPITPGTWHVIVGKAQLGGTPGHYTIDVTLRDAPTLTPGPRAAWQPIVLSTTRRWYAGDFHVHSRDSGDADATLDEIVDLARQRGLDFVVLSDHNTAAQVPRQAARQAGLSDLLLMRGAEVTTYHGHLNAVGVGRYVDHRIGYNGNTIGLVVDDIKLQGGLPIINHPELDLGDLCIGCAWRHDDTPWEWVAGIEIQTGNADLTAAIFTPRAIALWDAVLDEQHQRDPFRASHPAAIGGSDDHRAGRDTGPTASKVGSPTTMVLADSLSEAGVLAGVLAGRTVVKLRGPDDPMVELVAIDRADPAHTAGIGDTLRGDVERFELVATVTGARAEGASAELWRDGELVASALVAGGEVRFRRDAAGFERYRVELYVDGARATVTSHVFVDAGYFVCFDDCDGEGCCQTGGAPTSAVPGALTVALVLLRRRRRALRG